MGGKEITILTVGVIGIALAIYVSSQSKAEVITSSQGGSTTSGSSQNSALSSIISGAASIFTFLK